MTFPAYEELVEDESLPRTAVKLYRWLVRNHPQALREPVPVKTTAAGHAISRARRHVGLALQVLIDRGYLLDCGRRQGAGCVYIRLVMVPFLRQPRNPNVTRQDAA